MKIDKLQTEFDGKGEMRGYTFSLLKNHDCFYIFDIKYKDDEKIRYFEVFEAKRVKKCIDFDNKIFSDTEFKEVYPKSKDFGVHAWTYRNYESALNKFNSLCQ